ncbi:MAG: hypothetical protein AAF311_01600 [Pseudomonadota bacterium]
MAGPIAAHSPIADRLVAEDRRAARLDASRERRARRRHRLLYAIGPTLLVAMGATVVASAQSGSPFANKKKVNAWELPQNSAPTNGAVAPPQTSPLAPVPPAPPASVPATRVAAPVPVPPGGLQLRTRTLDASTATAPPPPAPTAAPAPTTAPTAARATPSPATALSSSTGTAAPTLPPLPEGLSYAPAPTAATTGGPATGTPSYQVIAPADIPPRWTLGAPSSGSQGPGLGGGLTGGLPRASVNNPPTSRPPTSGSRGSIDNEADLRVHQLARPRYPTSEEHWRDGGWERAQSPKPTAGDFGYGTDAPPPGSYGGAPYPSTAQAPQGPYGQGPYSSDPYAQGAYGQGPYTQGPAQGGPEAKPGFFQRLGLGRIATLIQGGLRAGSAARDRNGWEEAFIADADVEIELSTVTRGGLEWGVHGQVRAQYDEGRKGFTRRLPDCPPTVAGCPSLIVPGSLTPASVRGHTSQFYTDGPDVATDADIAVESAHLFLRSSYGDVTVGLDDGAAFLFSLGAPTLLNVGASNTPVDYTGLDAVKTLNDASGFAEKITYTSPRLLGDQVGVGVQLGLSYAPDASACGVDYCVDLNDVANVVAPDINDILEAGVALDRTFAPGVSVEATATYARGSEGSGLAGLDDLTALGAGLEFRMRDWTLGGSWLSSNQGLANGDYESYDIGLTWKPSALGFTLGYGQAVDDNVGLKSEQMVGGVTYDLNERIRFGAGVQHADRKTIRDTGGVARISNEKATALFIEAGITF